MSASWIEAAVVNCRFLKPYDRIMLERLVQDTKLLVTVEEGTVVNGFGALLGRELADHHSAVRVVAMGIADRLVEQAPRTEQLETFGLSGPGIAARVKALHHEGSLEAR